MREIKFRAWDTHSEYMHPWYEGPDSWWVSIVKTNNPQYRLMQFTGLRDKNRNEIYEGDIVTGTWNKTPVKGVVDFDEGMFGVTDIDAYSLNRLVCEVIGNIYENPDLLNNCRD